MGDSYLEVDSAKQTSKGWSNCHTQSTSTYKSRGCTRELLQRHMVAYVPPVDSPCPSQTALQA